MVVLERDESQGIFLVRNGMMVRSGMVKGRCFVLQGEKTVVALLHNEPRLTQALAQLQSKQLQILNRRMRLRASSANLRLLATLAERAVRSPPRAAATDPIAPLTQREFASLAGRAQETTSRTLAHLRHRGLVEDTPEPGLRLLNPDGLRRRGVMG